MTDTTSYRFVLDAVDDGIYATVEKHHDDGEVVECAREVDERVVEVEHEVVGLVPRPAEDEEERDGRQCLDDVGARTRHALVSLRFFAFKHHHPQPVRIVFLWLVYSKSEYFEN